MSPDEAHLEEHKAGNPASPAHACPQCGALLYSHRSRMCGHCGAVLPREFVVTDGEMASQREERQWARDLADRFDVSGRPCSERAPKPSTTEQKLAAAESVVRRMSCASEFRYRKRATWLYATGWVVTLLPLAAIVWFISRVIPMGREGLLGFGLLAGVNSLTWFVMWRGAMPICPNCHQNIRLCPAEYCQLCGRSLSHRRCADCGVDNSWTGWFRPSRNGALSRIAYCPGCGVELDTWVYRWHCD